MGDLKVGDEVFDKDGNITRVTFATPIMYNHKCYEVTFSDGEKIIADEEHNWLVDRWHKNNFHVETTKEIIDKRYIKHKGTTKYMESYVSIPITKSRFLSPMSVSSMITFLSNRESSTPMLDITVVLPLFLLVFCNNPKRLVARCPSLAYG